MKTYRSLWTFVLLALVGLFALPLLAQDTNPPAGGTDPGTPTTPGTAWSNLIWIVPILSPMIVMLLKKIPGWFETKLSARWLPYACIGVAFGLTLILDLMGKVSIPIWIAGPLAGAIGIGSRELLNNGLKLLGLASTTPEAKPTTPAGQ